MLEGTLPLFAAILLAQVLWGVGYTFISGAQDAWLADEIGEERLTQAYLRASQIGRGGALVGILIGMSLGTVRLGLPMLMAGALFVTLSFFLILFMPETGFAPTPRPERNSWGKMGDTFRDGLQLVRGRPTLMLILAITIFFGLSSEGWDRLREAHLLENFRFPVIGALEGPVIWFGVLSIVGLALSFTATEVIRRRVKEEEPALLIGLQVGLNLAVIGGIAIFSLAQTFGPAVAAMTAVYVARSANGPLFRGWINKQIKSRVRATVLSIWGQMDAIGQIVGGPILGTVATAFSIPAAMGGVVLLLMPVPLLYLVALRWATRGQKAERADQPA
jgi:DHA3 family tetracycline resistance protein-like MFS transporter